MSTKNEMIFINKILTTELSIRKAAKQFGLRRDDLIRRIKEALAGDEENLQQLELVIIINKMLFDNLKIELAAKECEMSVQELDKKILKTLSVNEEKMKRYLEYKKGGVTKEKKQVKGNKNFKNTKNAKSNTAKKKPQVQSRDEKILRANSNKRSK